MDYRRIKLENTDMDGWRSVLCLDEDSCPTVACFYWVELRTIKVDGRVAYGLGSADLPFDREALRKRIAEKAEQYDRLKVPYDRETTSTVLSRLAPVRARPRLQDPDVLQPVAQRVRERPAPQVDTVRVRDRPR